MQYGANVNAGRRQGKTALHTAIENGSNYIYIAVLMMDNNFSLFCIQVKSKLPIYWLKKVMKIISEPH